MKLKYDANYRCRNCGIIPKSGITELYESITCPKCKRSCEFVNGQVWRVEEVTTKKLHKTQKKLPGEII